MAPETSRGGTDDSQHGQNVLPRLSARNMSVDSTSRVYDLFKGVSLGAKEVLDESPIFVIQYI